MLPSPEIQSQRCCCCTGGLAQGLGETEPLSGDQTFLMDLLALNSLRCSVLQPLASNLPRGFISLAANLLPSVLPCFVHGFPS